jgi:hypothetical protein
MKIILLITFVFSSLISLSQNKKTEQILNEGKLLYRLEKGSWYGTDDMLARFITKKGSIGGYFSYETDENKINTVFFSRFESDKILIRYTFDSLPKSSPIKIDTLNHTASKLEKDLIAIRQDARERVYEESGKFFNFFENTSLNFIPLINGKEKNVFVLTGSQISGVVLIGNDYKLTYNKRNEFKKKEKIHNSLLQFAYNSENGESPMISTYHTHVLTDYISSTDICTLLLHKDYVEWNQHIVMSEKEVSIFDLDKEILAVMKREAWEKIAELQNDKK